MKNWLLAGAACAALATLCAPASAATLPEVAPVALFNSSADQAVSGLYASRGGSPLWLRGGVESAAARELIGILKRAPLDGLQIGPALAAQAQSLVARAAGGDRAALASADRLLSSAWLTYVQALRRPSPGMFYADQWVAPPAAIPSRILAEAAAAPSLVEHVRSVAAVNPVYAQLRDTAWAQWQAIGTPPDARVLASLDRVRTSSPEDRYLIVDAAAARLYMIEAGRIVDSMKVIVGKPSTQTPMLASTIYYAALNPYWNVPPELARQIIAPRVLQEGTGYLKAHDYQLLDGPGGDAKLLSPDQVDWAAVASGQATVRIRQLPGPTNSMGRMKFPLTNSDGIFLHDTPKKELFAQVSRSLSNGCVRLEDAERLGRWLMGREPISQSGDPEQLVTLPRPVPVYMTYLTAQANGGQLSFVDDPYRRDSVMASQVAALR